MRKTQNLVAIHKGPKLCVATYKILKSCSNLPNLSNYV